MEIVFFIGLGIILLYTIVTIAKFGIPDSLSVTHYHWKGVKEKYGHLFTFALWAFAFGNVVPMTELATDETKWFSFIACTALVFVGVASEYYEKDVKTTHFACAYTWAVASLLWCFFNATPVVPVIVALALGLTAIITDRGRHVTIWLELACAIGLAGSIISRLYF